MASYGSGFIYFYNTERDQVIERLAGVYFANYNTRINESGYEEIVILKNGIDMDNINLSDEDCSMENERNLIADRREIESVARVIADNLGKAKVEKENQEKIAASKAQGEAEKASRHQQYMKLKNEFAPN